MRSYVSLSPRAKQIKIDSCCPSERDEKDAIDKSNIIEEKTRGNTKPAGTYQAPGDEEGLPVNDGRSAIAQ
jgi:hypothetical protein